MNGSRHKKVPVYAGEKMVLEAGVEAEQARTKGMCLLELLSIVTSGYSIKAINGTSESK